MTITNTKKMTMFMTLSMHIVKSLTAFINMVVIAAMTPSRSEWPWS